MADQPISETQLIAKAHAYCARQERCQQEVRDKAYAWGAHREQVEQIMNARPKFAQKSFQR